MKRILSIVLLSSLLLLSSCKGEDADTDATTTEQVQTEGVTQVEDIKTVQPKWPVFDPPGALPLPQLARTVNPYSGGSELYSQSMADYKVEGPVTSFQVAAGYSGAIDIRADSVMLYAGTIASVDNLFKGWESSGKQLDCMIAINRENTEYVKMYPEKKDTDTQTRRDGSHIMHGGGTDVGYMVPTLDFIEYKWELIQKILEHNPSYIAFEEPELWTESGYSPSFKEEWKSYYGEDWQDPISSPEARLKSERLKIYLFERIINVLSERIHKTHPHVKVYIATHSIVSYDAINIAAGINQFAALPGVDGIIAQTWSDTSRVGIRIGGQSGSYPFIESFIEYSSYADCLRDDQVLFALADPKADDPSFTWTDYRKWYEDTLVASLLQQEIHRFEIFPWPDRSFLPAPDEYKTAQLSVFAALEELSGKASTLYAGTPGIYVGLSDTLSWQSGKADQTITTSEGYFGMTAPLVSKGVPVKNLSLDNLKSVDDLKGVNLLLLSYDCMLPKSEKANEVLAQWVKEGGTLLYLGGANSFQSAQGEWFTEKGQTPVENLMSHLEISGVKVSKPENMEDIALEWTGDPAFKGSISDSKLLKSYRRFTNIYEGEGFETVLKAGDYNLGIEKAAGKGKFIAVGLSTAQYASNPATPQLLRDIIAYALKDTGYDYVESGLMSVSRGAIVAAHSLEGTHTLKGRFIDLFDAQLPIINEKTIEADSSALLLDLDAAGLPSTPCLAFTGGELIGEATQSADRTEFTIKGPLNSVSSTRLLGNGRYPASIKAVRDGKEIDCIFRWENATSSLLVQLENTPSPVTIAVEWNDKPREDDPVYEYDYHTVTTNNKNEDSEFLVRTDAGANDSLRFADLASEIVYRFDLSKYTAPVIYLDVFQNYIIEVSDHDGDWQKVYDYSEINPVHLTDGSNRTLLTVDPSGFGYKNELWVRISNTDVSQGWGGSIFNITVKQKVLKK
ncbi:MAG: hypothetical protein AB9835_03065 [Eubacteriales bacterium]